jgi:hypothetical protein
MLRSAAAPKAAGAAERDRFMKKNSPIFFSATLPRRPRKKSALARQEKLPWRALGLRLFKD